jgi:ferredoxin
MRVRIDGDRCAGHGRCYSLVPELFEDDDRGFGVVRGTGAVGEGDVAKAERAELACPEEAVMFERRND